MPANRFLSETGKFFFVAIPKIISGFGTVGIGLLLLRHFGPEQFGMYSLCISGVLLADNVLGAAVDFGVLRLAPVSQTTDQARSYHIQRIALTVKVIIGGVALLGGALIPLIFELGRFGHLIFLSCAAAVSLLLFRTAQTQLQIEGRFTWYGALDLFNSALKFGGIGVLMAVGEVTPAKVLGCLTIGPAAAFLGWACTARGRAMLAGDFVNPERLAELFKHTRWVFLTFALAAITSRLDLLCLTAWSGIEQVGIFSAGATLVIVLQLIGTYASVILSPRVMPLWEEGRFFNFYRRFQFATFALCSLLLLVSIPLVEFCAPLLLPAKYLLSKQVIIALLPGALAGLATFPLTLTLLMFQRPRLLFWMDCTGIFLFVICYYLAVPVYGALGAAVVTSCICVFKATLAQIVAWRVAWRSQSFPLVGVSSSSASAVPIGVSGK